MANYSKTTWEDGQGEPINAAHLNNIESGITLNDSNIIKLVSTDAGGLIYAINSFLATSNKKIVVTQDSSTKVYTFALTNISE